MADNPYLKLVGGTEAPEAPESAPANPYLDILNADADAKRQSEARAILRAEESNPDERARALQLETETGIPADVAERNKAEVEKQAKLQRLRAVLDDAPKLAKAIEEDPELLTLAQDDAALLKLASPSFGTQAADVARAAPAGAVTGVGMGVKGLGELYETAGRSMVRPIDAALDAMGAEGVKDVLHTPIPWWLSPSEILKRPGQSLKAAGAEIAPPQERQNIATDISGAVGQIASQIGMALVNPSAAVTAMIGQGADIQAEEVDRTGKRGTVEGDNAVAIGAAVTGMTEKMGLDLLLNRVPPAIKNRILRQLTDIGIAGGIESVQEVTEGVLQNLTTQQLLDPNKDLLEGADRDAIAAGGAGAIVRGFINAATRGRSVQSQAQQADRAQQNADGLSQAVQAANESTLLTRDKARFEKAVQSMTGDAEVFIPAEPLREFFQSLPTDEAQALAAELQIDDQMADALDRGGDIVIPVGKYLSTLKDYHETLLPNVRLEQGGATLKEAQAFNEEAGSILREQADEVARETEQDRAGMEPVEKVREDVFSQLRLAGQTIDVAERNAALWAARYATRAERLGRDAFDLYQESPLRINQPLPEQLASRIDELDLMIERLKGGKRETDQKVKGLNLWEWVAAEGGVEDSGGELAAMDLDKQKVKVGRANKPIVRKGGADKRQQGMAGMGQAAPREASLEEMARRAADAGYLPEIKRQMEDPDAPAPDLINAFLEALRGGDKVFSETAGDRQAEEMRQAIDFLAEELDKRGIDYRTATREEIKAAIAAESQQPAEDGTRTLEQPDGGEGRQPRGSAQFMSDGRRVINLFEKANLSTFLHESGHLYLEEMALDASRQDAPDQIKADMQAILDWFGVKDWSEVGVEQHEQFARGFEAYLMKGEAPSVGLRDAFRRFAAWLQTLYRSVRSLRVNVTPEISAVMDRMLATDQEIALAERELAFKPLFADAETAGLTDAEFRAYTRLGERATTEAKEDLQKKLMAEVAREKTKWWAEEKARTRVEAEERVDAEPVQQALTVLREKDAPRLSRKAVAAVYGGPEVVKLLPRGVTAEDGTLHPDDVADTFGFKSGKQLIDALMNAPKREAAIEQETQRLMLERHGDMLNDGSLPNEALDSAQNLERGKAIAAELRILRKMQRVHNDVARNERKKVKGEQDNAREVMGAVEVDPEAYKAAARDSLARKPVNVATGHVAFERAEVQAAKAAEKAVAKGDWMEAARQKHRQMMNFYMAMESRKAKEKVEKAVAKFGRLNRKDEKFGKATDIDYIYAARAILSKFGLARSSFDFNGWMEKLRESDPQSAADLQLAVDAATAKGQDYKKMPLEEFFGLRDTVENLLTVGRNERTAELEGERVDLAKIDSELVDAVDGLRKPPENRPTTEADRRKNRWLSFKASLRRAESLASEYDKGDINGPWQKYLIRPLFAARSRFLTEQERVRREVNDLIVPKREEYFTARKIAAPELNGFAFNNKGELVYALLHTGNDSNMDKLLGGYGWDRAGWDSFIQRMIAEGTLTKADYDLVQSIWDLNESLKPGAQKTHRKVFGYYFDEVTARPFDTPFGTYKGGYMPAIADATKIPGEQGRAGDEAVTLDKGFMFPTTRKGFTKARTKVERPLSLDFARLPAHLNEVLLFTHFEPEVRQARRILKGRELGKAMLEVNPLAIPEVFNPFVMRSARQTFDVTQNASPSESTTNRWLGNARRVVGLQMLAGNLVNAIQQEVGYFPAASEVGAGRMVKAMNEWRRNPKQAIADVKSRSPYMKERLDRQASLLQGEFGQAMLPKNKREDVKVAVDKYGYFLQRLVDHHVTVSVWMAAFDKATSEGQTDKQATLYADSVVRQTQGENDPMSVSSFEAGDGLKRAIFMFYSWFNAQYNMLAKKNNIAFREASEGQISKLEAYKRAALYYATIIYMPAVLSEVIVQAAKGELGDEDDDGYLDDIFSMLVGAPARMTTSLIPGVNYAGNAIIGQFDDKVYNDRITVSPLVGAMERLVQMPGRIFGEGDPGKAVADILFAVGIGTGLPLGQAGKYAGAAVDMAAEK